MENIEIDYGEGYETVEAWLADRPACVRALFVEFPIGSEFYDCTGTRAWLIGYTERDELILSRVSPYLDWQAAVNARFLCEAKKVRAANKKDCANVRTH